MTKPAKPTPDFPLFPHSNGQWAKKIDGRLRYFGSWGDPDAALRKYLASGSDTVQSKVSPGAKSDKPPKPHKDFPLYPHASGKWAKRIRGRVHYFGSWDDPQAALEEYLMVKDDLLAGRTPSNGEGLTVRELVNRFLTGKRALVESGQIQLRTWNDYHKTAARIIDFFGPNKLVDDLQPTDFEGLREDLAASRSATTLSNEIGRVRVFFNYAYDRGLADRPVRYGQGFRKPSQRILRRSRQKRGPRTFQAGDLRKAIAAAGVQLRAMIYLGINCGLGNNDCMLLSLDALDLDVGWLDYPRPRTGVPRRCPLWPETTEAIRQALAGRPDPRNAAFQDRVFITKYGNAWEPKSDTDNPVSNEMGKLLRRLGIHRPGLNFYALRHTFQTIGQQTLDKDAVRYIMGYADNARDMSAVCSEGRPSDERLREVTDHVRDWLRNTPSRLEASVENAGEETEVAEVGSE